MTMIVISDHWPPLPYLHNPLSFAACCPFVACISQELIESEPFGEHFHSSIACIRKTGFMDDP